MSDTEPVGDIAACCFTGPHDPDHVSPGEPIISGNRVAMLYSGQLGFFHLVPVQQVIGQDNSVLSACGRLVARQAVASSVP